MTSLAKTETNVRWQVYLDLEIRGYQLIYSHILGIKKVRLTVT